MERRNGMSLREAMRRNARAQRAQPLMEENVRGGVAPGAVSGLARVYRSARQSGQLNLSTRHLTEFPTDILRLLELVEPDEKSWECVALAKVDLSYNELPSVPSEIRQLQYLTSLKIRHNRLTALPEEFFELTALTSLDLSNNLLEGSLSESLGKLTNLRDLGLEHNKLSGLPESLCSLEYLEALRVEENQLTALPARIGDLQRLRTLGAHSNQLATLPASFAQLTNLTTLDLKKNALVSLGEAIVSFSRLRFVDVRQNKLQEFPSLPYGNPPLDQLMLGYNSLTDVSEESILRVKDTLTVLDLRDNKLQALPERFAHLYRLKTLDLSNNDLHDLPPGLGYLKHLHHMTIDGNPLRSIRRSAISAGTQALKKYLRTRGSPPEGVDALEEEFDEFALREKHTREQEEGAVVADSGETTSQFDYLFRDAASNGNLQMVDMRLQTWPEQLLGGGRHKFAETLVQLNVSKNRLGELPKALGEMQALQTLVAEDCGLQRVDPSIAMLNQLQHLRLRKNFLKTEAVEDFLVNEDRSNVCHSLKELDLRNNYIGEMPSRCRFLVMVDTLLLSYNRMKELDDFPWASMRRLSVVSLADNQLESLGTIYDLPLLTSLSVENNNLRVIPPELGLCENLRALYLVGNPQRSIRLNIVNEGADAILKHLRNRLPMGMASPPAKAFVDTAPTGTRPQNAENVPPRNSRATSTETATASGSGAPYQQQRQQVSPNPADYKRARRVAVSPGAQLDLRHQPSFGAPAAARAPTTPNPTPAPAPVARQLESSLQPAAAPAQASANSVDEVLEGYNERIKVLETQLEDFALSQPKKFALKKELAMVRSLKIRHTRATSAA